MGKAGAIVAGVLGLGLLLMLGGGGAPPPSPPGPAPGPPGPSPGPSPSPTTKTYWDTLSVQQQANYRAGAFNWYILATSPPADGSNGYAMWPAGAGNPPDLLDSDLTGTYGDQYLNTLTNAFQQYRGLPAPALAGTDNVTAAAYSGLSAYASNSAAVAKGGTTPAKVVIVGVKAGA